MVTIITTSIATLSWANIFGIDMMVILILIELLTFKEFIKSYFGQTGSVQQDNKLNIEKLSNIVTVPFLYVFCYVLIYRVQLLLNR